MQELTDATYGDFMASAKPGEVTVLDFWSASCRPCVQLAPHIEELAAENPEVRFAKVNAYEELATANQHGITNLPTVLVVKDGKVVGDLRGTVRRKALEQAIEAARG